MKYISFITDHCKETAKRYGLVSEIEGHAKKIEKDQSIQYWDKFLPTPYIKKDLGKSFRVVCAQQTLNDETIVISFLSCFARGGDGEYERKFIENPGQVCGKYLPPTEALQKHLLSRVEPIPAGHPMMSDIEAHYLYDSIISYGDSDVTIFETPEWAELINTPRISDLKTRFYDCLKELVDDQNRQGQTLKDDAKNGVRILYRYFPSLKSLLLIAPLKLSDQKEYDRHTNKYQTILNGKPSVEEVLKLSRRSYPSFVLADEVMWGLIQKNEVGNIALSPEESKILDDVSRKIGEKLFPLFINGRPGSGKSTILQYLFAEYLCMHLRKDESLRLPVPPLYLTYSERLLNSAKKVYKPF